MGLVCGAANIWQWVKRDGEPGHAPFFLAGTGSWRDALDYEGSAYVGLVGKILDGLPTTDMAPDWQTFIAPRGLRVPGRLHVVYQEYGGILMMKQDHVTSADYRIIDPRTGKTTAAGTLRTGEVIEADPAREARVVIFDRFSGGC
jgi:hypothetical protein